jgi:hypothetical protein
MQIDTSCFHHIRATEMASILICNNFVTQQQGSIESAKLCSPFVFLVPSAKDIALAKRAICHSQQSLFDLRNVHCFVIQHELNSTNSIFPFCLSFASAKHNALTERERLLLLLLLLFAAILLDLHNVSIATPTPDEWRSK